MPVIKPTGSRGPGVSAKAKGPMRLLRSGSASDILPDLGQLGCWFIRNVLQLSGALIPIPAVVAIAFNLMQNRVNPGSGRVRLVLLHHFMGSISDLKRAPAFRRADSNTGCCRDRLQSYAEPRESRQRSCPSRIAAPLHGQHSRSEEHTSELQSLRHLV